MVSEDDLLVLNARLDDYGIRRPKPPPGEATDIRSFVVDVARLAGFHPRRSQPLPGIMKLWQGYVLLRESVFTYRALRRRSMAQNGKTYVWDVVSPDVPGSCRRRTSALASSLDSDTEVRTT